MKSERRGEGENVRERKERICIWIRIWMRDRMERGYRCEGEEEQRVWM